MAGYEPIDLGPVCNAGVHVLGEASADVPLGSVELRGLPFLIGSEPVAKDRCFVVPNAPVAIEIGRAARRVIIAHRLLQPAGRGGHGVGTPVADYAFRLAGGVEMVVPIRERFEIQVVGGLRGREPYLAVSDTNDGSVARFEGPWAEAGLRHAEHERGFPRAYYLWCWESPDPGAVVERLEIVPRGLPFLIAGITLGHEDEHPFVRTSGRPVRLVVTDSEAAARPGVLDVAVDRGSATYPHRLPVGDDRPGYGASNTEPGNSPAYASVAAVPSATVVVRHEGEELGRVQWSDVQRDGHADGERVRVELVESGRNWVHVTVLDDATGKPVPCRVHFCSPDGVPYQPYGHHNHVHQDLDSARLDVGADVRLGGRTYAYIDGSCQGWLPRGDVVVDAARGFEYEPLRETVRIVPGQRELTLRLHRMADMATDGWWSGDSHVHFLSTAGAQLEQRGEDLRVVNLLQSQWGALFSNTEDFTGRESRVHGTDYLTWVGQENRQHVLGHVALWGLTEPVMPWCSDGPREAELGGALDATLSDWADRTHAQGGTVIAAHFHRPNGEHPALIASGRADAVEILAIGGQEGDDGLLDYYTYLNAGYRLPLVGGTDKMGSSVPVGLYRTYARLDPGVEFSYHGWCRAVRRGRTFLSGGPLLSFAVDGRQAGDTVTLSGPGTVTVEVSVTSIFPLHVLEIVCNGEVIATVPGNGGRHLSLCEQVRITRHSWIVCRAFGSDHHLDVWGRRVFAHTSPVYVACGEPWQMADPHALRYLRSVLEGARSYLHETAALRADDATTHHHGGADHLAWLERPFVEALTALDARSRPDR